MKPWFVVSAGGVLMILLTACGTSTYSTVETIQGSGKPVTIRRDVDGFSSIAINLAADVTLIESGANSLTVEADDNLLPYIQTDVHNDTLIISTPPNISLASASTIRLKIDFDTLRAIHIAGTSNITAYDLVLDELAISFAGSGSTTMTGSVDELTINIQGQAIINNFDLASQHVNVDIRGNGTIGVNAQDTLHVTVAGMGNIHYTGNPTVTQAISGAAVITRSSD